MNNWLVASYKINELKKLETNLKNQNFAYYLPKIFTQKVNSISKEEVLFPGYIFVKIGIENYSALKFTRGIKSLIRFGNNFSCLNEDEIKNIKLIEKESRINPLRANVLVGQEAYIKKGSFKGSLVKICSLPAKKRLDVFIYMLGSKRRVNLPIDSITI
jgi:transcription antitermination factor NusG